MGQHEYLLKTDRSYREQIATEVLLRLSDLIRILAFRQGLTWDPSTGQISGLTKEEEELLGSIVYAVDRSEVKEASPDHRAATPASESIGEFDPYVTTPSPDSTTGSEEVEAGDDEDPSLFAKADVEAKPRRRSRKTQEAEETPEDEG